MTSVRWLSMLAVAWVLSVGNGESTAQDAAAHDAGDAMRAYTESLTLRGDASLTAVSFGDADLGIACGDHGAILRTSDGGRTWSLVDSGVSCRLEDISWLSPSRAVIVGGSYDPITRISRGVVLRTEDGGSTWKRGEDEELPTLRRLEREANGTLIASGDWSHSLLTNRVESHNSGRSWDGAMAIDAREERTNTRRQCEQWVRATRYPVAVRDAGQIDGETLCTVGDHGIIQRSGDGGKSWQVVRGPKRRTSVLLVAKDPSTVAWSLIGNEALEHRNRTALLLADPDGANLGVTRQAVAMLGGASVDLLDGTGQVDEASYAAAASGWLQVHRPMVLVIDSDVPRTLQDALLDAATQAGVGRVVHYSRGGSGSTTLHRDALLARTGVLASDLQLDAMHLIAPDRAFASSVSIRIVYDVATTTRRSDSVTSGLAIRPGHRLDAPAPTASRRRLQMAQARMQQIRRVDEFVSNPSAIDRFRTTLAGILDQTAKEDQFRVAWTVLLRMTSRNVARSFQRVVLEEIAERFPDRSYGQWALLRAEALMFSRERSQLRRPPGESIAQPASMPAAVPVSPFQVSQSGVSQASAVVPLLVPDHEPQRTVTTESSETSAVDLNWEFHPLVLLARDAARRRGDDGTLQPADGQSADLARLADAPSEEWSNLIYAGGRAINVRRALQPPRLDGVLDDPCWQSALPRAGSAAQLRLAYDDQYLYVAFGFDAETFGKDTSRPDDTIRDHDLSGVDRVRLRFDTDRDLITSMQLQVSATGRTHDAIDGNRDWQPTWYVDTNRVGGQVIVEIALSRYDIADLPIPAGEIWFASVELIPAGEANAQPDYSESERLDSDCLSAVGRLAG